ncbi:hypothetical protein GC176_08940 [bacterium]|nr:hypothetical protein [bacterium]
MRHTTIYSTVLATLLLAAGCLISDELTTITIQPDGAADWVRFQSDIHSTEKGMKGELELQKFVSDFDSQQDADLVRIVEAGGAILDARWVRREKPYATLVSAEFPCAEVLEKFFTVKDEKGEVLARPTLTIEGKRRRFSISIPIAPDEKAETTAAPTAEEILARQADSISGTRIVVANGHIVKSQGFAVARDGHSCVLNSRQIDKLLHDRPARVEIFLEWEVNGD